MNKQVWFYHFVASLLSLLVLGGVLVACGVSTAPQTNPQPQTSIQQTFENQITLLGFTEPATRDRLQLFWQAAKTPAGDYSAFVHLLDEQGRVVAQMDKTPGNGNYPTSQWKQGQVIVDEYAFNAPNLVSGTYTLQIGLYDPTTGKRLALEGNANGTVTVSKFEIKTN